MVDVSPEPNVDDGGVRATPARPAYAVGAAARWTEWRHEPRLLTIALVVVVIGAGAWWVRLSSGSSSGASPRASNGATTSPTTSDSPAVSAVSSTTTATVFVVDVVGAVPRPGVVTLPGTARVVDAVNAAGGALATADLDRINLAAHLVDGMRIAVPRRGAPADPAAPTNDPGATAAGPSGPSGVPTASTPLDLNTATEPQLEALPGIGPSLAQAILQEREREGGFHSVDDLRRVRGIGDVRFAQLKPLVTT